MSDQINLNKFHTINSTMSFQREERWKYIMQLTGNPCYTSWANNSLLQFIGYLSLAAGFQDNACAAYSVSILARQLIWVDFDDLQVFWAKLAVPAWASHYYSCVFGVFNASDPIQSQYTVVQVSVQTNKSRYELDWNWIGENEIKMREWERWEIDEIHFRAHRVMLAPLHVCKWTHLKEVGGQFTFHSAP